MVFDTDPLAASRLMRAARRYQALAADRHAFLWAMDTQLRPTGPNLAWEEYTGQSQPQYFGLGWLDAIAESDRDRCMGEIKRHLPLEQPFSMELAIRRRDGVYRRHVIRAIPVRDEHGTIVEWLGTATDVEADRTTADREATEHRELRERLVALTDGAESLLRPSRLPDVRRAICDLAARVLPADAYAMWSFDVAESVWQVVHSIGLPDEFVSQRHSGTEVPFTEPLVADDLQTHLLAHRADAYRQAGIKSLISVPLPIDGVRRGTVVAYYLTPHRTTKAEVQVAVALGHLAAAAISNVEARLRQEALRADAQRANRAKDEFLALLSHELRTPLNAVMGWTQILLSPPSAALVDAQHRRGLEIIRRNARQQAELVDGLLDVARVATGGLPLTRQPIDLGDAVHSAMEAIRPVAAERHLELHLSLESNACRVLADPNRFQQILSNLLSNALKFTQAGDRIDVRVAQIEKSCEISVTDTGAGIAPEFLPHVFERFRQADSSTTRRHGGLGLGLWLVQELVRAHGGTITASSDGPGRGSTFVVRLPVAE